MIIYSNYADYTAEIVLCLLLAFILFAVVLIPLIYIEVKGEKSREKSKSNLASVLRKYDTMNTSEVTKHTINNFHTELHECFPSDKEYYDYVSAFDNDTAFEICRIDMKLLSDLTLNKDNDSLDTEPIDSSRYERYM